MSPVGIALIIGAVLVLGVIIFPLINRAQFNRLPFEQKVRILMKQAKGLIFFKNVSGGRHGTLFYIKNKRKIYSYPWELIDGKMICTRKALFDKWDYPEEEPEFNRDEIIQAVTELDNYNKNNAVKLYIDYDINE